MSPKKKGNRERRKPTAPLQRRPTKLKAPSNKDTPKRGHGSPAPEVNIEGTLQHSSRTNSFPVVGIGASAGGLEAFTELLKNLPLDTGLGFVLIQHLDPVHQSALAILLSRATSMPVREVTNNLHVEANHVYVIPPNTTLSLVAGTLKLQLRKQERSPTRSIDSFFESLAQDQRERAIGVILSGTASDGTVGLEAIKAEGGLTFAQDASAKYDSMPRSAVAAGCVDFVLSPADIAKELARIAKHPYVAGQTLDFLTPEDDRATATEHEDDDSALPSGGHGSPHTGAKRARVEAAAAKGKTVENGFKKVLLLLRNHSGVDFTLYKSSTIQRRIGRRVVLNKQDSLVDYANFLRGNNKELDALYSDMLISVTSFFRNPAAFDLLKRKVFPKLLQQQGDDPFRIWVLGCSTGQEAYSLAMAFLESAEKAPRLRRLQVFATDLNDALLEKARHGLYSKSLAEDVSPQRLRRFFVEEEGGYRIVKSIREKVVFARQNLISDPPFSRMDLISCRNLLIYLEQDLQKKALPTFHYALKPGGFLFLGASESIGSFTDLFEPVDKKQKIYSKKAVSTHTFHLPVRKENGERIPFGQTNRPPVLKGQQEAASGLRHELTAQREADRMSVNRFAPPGVLINAELQILQFRGPTSAYLQPPASGKATFDVLKMAREGLMLPLRATINEAKKENKIARRENVRVNEKGDTRLVNIEVVPLKNVRERCFLILFEDAQQVTQATGDASSPNAQHSLAPTALRQRRNKEETRRSIELERELAETSDYLQSIQEQYEAANEELQASNEEVQSANEELQSINEELETSKEELESANEELTTVNEEMANRNAELNRLNSDLSNLQTSTKLPIVMLGRDLTIRRFSAQAEKQFNLLATDVGRPITNVRHNLDVSDLEDFILEVIATVREREREVQDKNGHWYSLRVRPYITLDNKVDGAALVLVDIDRLKRSEATITAARDYAEAIIKTVPVPLIVLDENLRARTANRAFYENFHVSPEETEKRFIYDLGNQQWDIPKLRSLLEEILPLNNQFQDFEVEHEFEKMGQRTMLLNARRMRADGNGGHLILLAIEDITERKRSEDSQKALNEQLELELNGTQRLQETSMQLIHGGDTDALYQQILDAATALMHSDMGSVQMFYPERGALRLLAWKGFNQESATFWEWVLPTSNSTCGVALNTAQRVQVSDVETCGFLAGTEDLTAYRKSGIRAAQSTPLISRPGKIVGMISTHWREPYQPSARELRLFDLLARQAADLIERQIVEQAVVHSEERFRSLVSVLTNVPWTTNAEGAFNTQQHAWEAYTGQSWEEYRGFGWTSALHADDRERVKELWLAAIDNRALYESDGRLWHAPSQQWRYFTAKATPLFSADGDVREWVGTYTDVQDLRLAEAELSKLMQKEKAARSAAEAANHVKDEFLAMISHELRTPLNAIVGWTHLLRRGKLDQRDTERAIQTIDRNATAQAAIINELLDVSRIISGKLKLDMKPVDLMDVINQAVEVVRPAAEAKLIEIVTSLDHTAGLVAGDSVRLQQVIWNLLTNAIKFTPKEGRVEVQLERSNTNVAVFVSDTGAGIPSDFLPHIFERFQQADLSEKRSHGGLGLGLSIVRNLVEMHGGSVNAESEGEGRGARFIVTLPVLAISELTTLFPASRYGDYDLRTSERDRREEDSAGGPQVDLQADILNGVRVLAVDDQPDTRELLILALTRYGAEVRACTTPSEALRTINEWKPQVIVSDIGMPGEDGYDLMRKIRALTPEMGGQIPAIALTGYAGHLDESKAYAAGYQVHMTKPLALPKLVATIAYLSGR